MESMSLLNMLAEVASEKLQTDPTVRMITEVEEQNSPVDKSCTSQFQQNQGKRMTLLQLSTISENTILRLFTVSQANELKRKFYFTCRLIPQHCEETFQSFGSEDKARNLMKKHLKEHLQDLLEKFKDSKSRENYILWTVEKVTKNSTCQDAKSSIRRHSNPKAEVKSKFSYEKENSSSKVPSMKEHTPFWPSMISTSNSVIPGTSVTTQQITPVLKPESSVRMSVVQSIYPTSTSGDKFGISSPPVTVPVHSLSLDGSIQERSLGMSSFVSSSGNSQRKRCTVNKVSRRKESSKKQKTIDSYQQTQQSSTTVQNNDVCPTNMVNFSDPNFSESDTEICCTDKSRSPISCSLYENDRPATTLPLVQSPVKSNSNVMDITPPPKPERVINPSTEIVPTQKQRTEIIDIRMEETIKLEVLDTDQQFLMTNSSISHDHGYVGIENNFDCIKVEKEEVVVSSDHSQHHEFISESSNRRAAATYFLKIEDEPKHSSESKAKNLLEKVSKGKDVCCSENDKRKMRLKGKGKFIGQSKDEKEMALTLIEKIKSHSFMQIENLECNICIPPRVFTAPSTLLSHYKSHAGIRPYVCPLCEAVFTRQHSLNYHLLIHSNQTRFTCDDCGRKFRHPSHFKEHRRRHTGESPYKCMDCFMRFKTRNTYKRHLRTRHGKKLTTQGSVHSVTEDVQPKAMKNEPPETSNQEYQQQNHKLGEEKIEVSNMSSVCQPENVSLDTILNAQTGDCYTDMMMVMPNHGNDFNGHSDIEYPEMIPFNTQVGVYDVTKYQSRHDCLRVINAMDVENTSSTKQYHEMMPMEASEINKTKDCNEWAVVEFDSNGLSKGRVTSYIDNVTSTSTTYNHPLQELQGSNSAPAVPLNYLDQHEGSTLSFSNDNGGVLLVINESGSVSNPVRDASSNDLVHNTTSNSSTLYTSTSVSNMSNGNTSDNNVNNNNECNEKSVLLNPHVNGLVSGTPSIVTVNGALPISYTQSRSSLTVQTEPRSAPPHFTNVNAADVQPSVKGSILNTLLTFGGGRNRVASQSSTSCFAAAPPKVYESNPFQKSCVKESSYAVPSPTDKWDSLMREVVSLSSAVKEKLDTRVEPPSTPVSSSSCGSSGVPPVKNNNRSSSSGSDSIVPMKELNSNVQPNRQGVKDTREVYVLKYVSISSGNRIAKVFKAKSLNVKDTTGAKRNKSFLKL